MRNGVVLLISLALLMASCDKKFGEGVVQGTVTDISTGKPASGALVKVVNNFHEKKTSAANEQIVATAITDAEGKYKINYTRSRPGWQNEYKVATFSNDNFISEGNQVFLNDVMSTTDLTVRQKGFVKFKLTKTTTKPCNITINVDLQSIPYLVLQNSIYTDSIFKMVVPVRGNLNSVLCVSATYVNDNITTNFCSTEKLVSVGDTVVFSVTYE